MVGMYVDRFCCSTGNTITHRYTDTGIYMHIQSSNIHYYLTKRHLVSNCKDPISAHLSPCPISCRFLPSKETQALFLASRDSII